MKFFFADNLDAVNPDFSFEDEENKPDRSRQSKDLFAHECLQYPPYDGILVSKSVIGGGRLKGRYSQGQRLRLSREGIRKFLRFPCADYDGDPEAFPIMGDCGAFSYIRMEVPPVSVEEVFTFYENCGFTYGVSPDHVITEKNAAWDRSAPPRRVLSRADYTLRSAIAFLKLCQERTASFHPIGVVQSWSPQSAVRYARILVDAGYSYIGLGGLAGRPTRELLDTIAEVRSGVPASTRIHVFGMTRIDRLQEFFGLGLNSFDSASPMVKAFKDDRHNYFSTNGPHFKAIRIPSAIEATLKRRIESGALECDVVMTMEKACVDAMEAYSHRQSNVKAVVEILHAYEHYLNPNKDNRREYTELLVTRPWEECGCEVCRNVGIQVVVFRGLNRNKRRGFHNLHVFYDKLRRIRGMDTIGVPCLRVRQNQNRCIYSFVVNGKDIPKFASVSRISRADDGLLAGYQRPEIQEHIADIRRYIDTPNSIMPNSIVVAFDRQLDFKEDTVANEHVSTGVLRVPISEKKCGWIVDGQQRTAAIRACTRESFFVSVVAFESDSIEQEREQFVLVNNTKPLPKNLVYELLPSLERTVPPRLRKRQVAYRLLERLNLELDSPFYCRIRTVTSQHLKNANIKDLSVLKMIENSMDNGVLLTVRDSHADSLRLLKNYWTAVSSYYAEAWSLPPNKSRLTHGAGIVSMGFLMDTMAYMLIGHWRIPPAQAFLTELKKLGCDVPWLDGSWNFGGQTIMPWKELQNTAKHIELLTNHLIRKYKGVCHA